MYDLFNDSTDYSLFPKKNRSRAGFRLFGSMVGDSSISAKDMSFL